MHIPQNLADEAFTEIKKAGTILIISHRNPDADTIGSNLALREVFERHRKKVISACVDSIPENIFFIKNADKYEKNFDLTKINLVVCVDAGSTAQVAFGEQYPDIFSKKIPLINIDHHASNNHYGTVNIVYPEAASTTIILFSLFQAWQESITKNMATCLLYGLYYDTGSFMHSNTNAEVYEVGGALINLQANLKAITKNLFHNHSVEQLKLWGKVFSEAELTTKNIVVAGISYEELQKSKTKNSDLSGAIDYLNMVKGNIFATIVSEDGKGNIRGSLRTKNDIVNLSEVAELLGGGGHKKASGFSFEGKLQKEVRWKITADFDKK